MTRLSETIQRVLADQRVTDAEVAGQLEPLVDAEGVLDPNELRPLHDALASNRVSFEADAATRVTRILSLAGYMLRPPDAQISATRPAATPNQPFNAPDAVFNRLARATGHTNEQIPVAVADKPVDFTHTLLAGHAWVNPRSGDGDCINGRDMVRNSCRLGNPKEWHGNASTFVTVEGTDRIRAIGVTVIADDDAPRSSYEPLFRGIDYAVAQGARVITMSTTMEREENAARFRDILAKYPHVLFVLAAGNENRQYDATTARLRGADVQAPNLLVVGASDATGGIWRGPQKGSNTGSPFVSIAAQGANVRVPFSLNDALNGRYDGFASGTSLATPKVANIGAKCMLLSPRLTASDVVNVIMATADVRPAWIGRARANGTVNPERAMTVAAVIGLVADQVPLDAALDRVQVTASERGRVRAAVRQLMNL